jgi:hypothetical protein
LKYVIRHTGTTSTSRCASGTEIDVASNTRVHACGKSESVTASRTDTGDVVATVTVAGTTGVAEPVDHRIASIAHIAGTVRVASHAVGSVADHTVVVASTVDELVGSRA